ncbi:MAG: type II toxin-antitoxin system RelE/ParE family toxin [Bacillota bacterium]
MRGNLALTEYKVVIELPAQRDLQGILRYIADTLKEPAVARRIYTSIKEQIQALSQMPLRHSVVQDQPYAAMGVRKLLVENYIAFYIINEAKCEVHVLRILYNRREWQYIL